jgi:hypothetical protein
MTRLTIRLPLDLDGRPRSDGAEEEWSSTLSLPNARHAVPGNDTYVTLSESNLPGPALALQQPPPVFYHLWRFPSRPTSRHLRPLQSNQSGKQRWLSLTVTRIHGGAQRHMP